MQDLPQLSSQLSKLQKGSDTSQQVLRLMDELTGNFRSALASAEDKHAAKTTASQNKAPEKTEDNPEAEATEKAVSEEGAQTEAPTEEATAEVSEEQLVLPEEVAANSSEIIAEAPENEGVELAEEAEAEIELEELEVAAENEVPVEANTELPQQVSEEAESPELEAQLEAAETEEAELAAPVQAQNSQDAAASTDVEGEAIESELSHRRVARKLPQQAAEVANSNEDAASPESEADSIQLKEFHNIKPEQTEIMTDKAEANKVQSGLQQIAAQTQVQAPKVEHVSAKVIEGLKAVNAPMAKGLEGAAKSTAMAQGAVAKATGSKFQVANPNLTKSAEKAPGTEMDRRIQDMKAKVIEQVRFKVKMALKGKLGEIKMQLNPKFLGKVNVQLKMEDSALRASFLVDNQSVKDLLTRHSPTLQNALSEQGIDLSELEVNVANEGAGDGENGRAFASAEDQQAMKEWLGSFYRFGPESDILNGSDSSQEESTVGDSDQVLNVVA